MYALGQIFIVVDGLRVKKIFCYLVTLASVHLLDIFNTLDGQISRVSEWCIFGSQSIEKAKAGYETGPEKIVFFVGLFLKIFLHLYALSPVPW